MKMYDDIKEILELLSHIDRLTPYCSDDYKLLQQSKGLRLQKFKRMNLICSRENGRVVFSYSIISDK